MPTMHGTNPAGCCLCGGFLGRKAKHRKYCRATPASFIARYSSPPTAGPSVFPSMCHYQHSFACTVLRWFLLSSPSSFKSPSSGAGCPHQQLPLVGPMAAWLSGEAVTILLPPVHCTLLGIIAFLVVKRTE